MFSRFGLVSYCPATKVDGFVTRLEEGELCATHCAGCGRMSFPPRADCPVCGGEAFTWEALSGRGRITTFTRIAAAPAGFADLAPYTLAVIELAEGGRLLGLCGRSLDPQDITVGALVQVVPRRNEPGLPERVFYTLEHPDTVNSSRRNGGGN